MPVSCRRRCCAPAATRTRRAGRLTSAPPVKTTSDPPKLSVAGRARLAVNLVTTLTFFPSCQARTPRPAPYPPESCTVSTRKGGRHVPGSVERHAGGQPLLPAGAAAPGVPHRQPWTTVCPWKGAASYYDVTVNGQVNRDAGWYYLDPGQAAAKIQGHVTFRNASGWHGPAQRTGQRERTGRGLAACPPAGGTAGRARRPPTRGRWNERPTAGRVLACVRPAAGSGRGGRAGNRLAGAVGVAEPFHAQVDLASWSRFSAGQRASVSSITADSFCRARRWTRRRAPGRSGNAGAPTGCPVGPGCRW